MPYLFVYLIKVNIALVIFCLGYYAVLRKLTFYTLNRVYLVCSLLFSTLYPLVNLSVFFRRHEQVAQPLQIVIVNWQAPVAKVVEHVQHNYLYWLQIVFWIGVVLMALRLLVQLLSLFRIHKQSESTTVGNYTVRKTHKHINPFSFWQSIYINPDSHTAADLPSILAHEQIHVKQWHTLDILLGELSIVFYWFNPGVWLMKKAIVENIEFITDQKILQNGLEAKAYQYSLLNVGLNAGGNILVNNFNLLTIKKRIIMMNSERSSRLKLARYAMLLPATLALVLVFTVSKAELTKTVSRESVDMVKTIKAAVVNINSVVDSTVTAVAEGIKIVPAISTNKVTLVIANDTAQVSSQLPIGDTLKKQKNIAVNIRSNKLDSAVWIVDGRIIKNFELKELSPNNIETINISKPNEGALKGLSVVVVETKANFKRVNPSTVWGLGGIKDVLVINDAIKNKHFARVTVDTVVFDTIRFKNLPKSIKYTIVPANVDAIRINAKIDSLRTRNSAGMLSNLKEVLVMGRPSANAGTVIPNMTEKIFIIDGKEATEKQRKKLSANDIESLSLITGKAATTLYGDKGKNGVIVITTKKKN